MTTPGQDEVHPGLSSTEAQLDRQVYSSEFELAKTRPRPKPESDSRYGQSGTGHSQVAMWRL